MQYDEFVGEVQNRTRLPSQGDAVRAIQATLETLAERITAGEASDLAAQLDPALGTFLRDADTTERFSVDEFFLRVAAKETADLPDAVHHTRAVFDVLQEAAVDEFFLRVAAKETADLPDAVHHTRAVFDVLQEAVTTGEMEDVRAQLPDDYDTLFEAGSEGEMDINV